MPTPISVADALFGKTRQAVLAMLFGNPGRAFYTREIVKAAASGVSQVQRELDQMTRSGLVTRDRRGNQVYFQANPAAAIHKELVSLVAKSFGIADAMRDALSTYSEKIRVALVYGSVARGEHHATSDIDVLIVGDVLLSEIEIALDAAEKHLARVVSTTVMTWSEYVRRRTTNEHFLRAVMAGPKIFLVGGSADLKLKGDHDAG